MAGCGPGLPSSQPRLNSPPAGHCVSAVGRQKRHGGRASKSPGDERRHGGEREGATATGENTVQKFLIIVRKKKLKVHRFCVLK